MSRATSLRIGNHQNDHLIDLISPWVQQLGYQIIYLEVHTLRQKTLRIFIDHLSPQPGQAIGIEDCVKVTRALEEPLDQIPEVEAVFKGPYELEVSSPGVDRPLRTSNDFERFAGQQVRIHVFRPLTHEELGNSEYYEKNPKQKNFIGILMGLKEDRLQLSLQPSITSGRKPSQKGVKKTEKASLSNPNPMGEPTNSAEKGSQITIPLPLIAKANLEPVFDLEFDSRRATKER